MGKTKTHRSLSTLKRQFKYRKPICPFICSTFQDFQVERDILVKKVFPAIDAICRERGTYCAPVDLRWGINDYQASSGQIINLCLDYVTRCAPFFLCILGERYGSCRPENSPPLPASYRDLSPDAHWMDKNLVIAAALGYDWVASEPHCSSSVTALEIAQRNLLSATLGDDFSFYYVRQQEHLDHLFNDLPDDERQQRLKMYQPESEYSNRKMRQLKDQIAKRGLPLKYFKTPDELRLLVLYDWKAVVDCLYPPFYDEIPQTYMGSVKEWIAHEAFAESRRRVYISTPELDALFSDLTQFALTSLDEPPPVEEERSVIRAQSYSSLLRRKKQEKKPLPVSTLLLVGERGCGKSAIIANWYRKFEESHPEVKVFTHFVGSSAQSTDLHAMIRRFTREIQNEYPDFVDNEDNDVSEFHNVCEAFHAALSLGPCVLVLDGVDELAQSYGCSYKQVKEMTWLPYPLPPQCKVIITCARSDAAHKSMAQRDDIKVLSVPLLKDTRSKTRIVREYLAIHCKCLDKSQLSHIVNCKLSDKPIFLTVLANELRVFGVYSRLDYHLESYLDALSVRDLWSKIILRWVRDYSWSSEQGAKSESGENDTGEITGWVADALRLIACSRNGLTQDEILDILEELGYYGNSKVTSLDWALFRSAAMDSLLERPEGLINFFHQHFKEAVEHTLLGSPTPGQTQSCGKSTQNTIQEVDYSVALCPKKSLDRCHFHKHIADHFLKRKPDNRQLEELPWQLERAGEFDQLAKVLSEPRLFLEMAGDGCMNHKRLELVKYWKILQQRGYSVTKTYWHMLRKALGRDTDNEFGSEESLALCSISTPSSISKSPCSSRTSSAMELGVPDIVRTSPTLSSQDLSVALTQESEDRCTEDMSVIGSTRSSSRASLLSEKSCGSVGSYSSSEIDITEAFIDGRAKGPKAMARLTMTTGQFLSVLSCFADAERMLLAAHSKLGQISFSGDCQRLLCGLEESLANMYLFQLRQVEAVHWFTRALSTVEELLIVLRCSEDEKSLIEMKGRLLEKLGNMCTHNRDFKTAETMLTRAKACFEEARSCTGKATVQYRIGFLRMQQGDFESAERLFTEALLNFERWFGKNHPRLAEIINDLARLLSHPNNKCNQDIVQAEYLYRRALQIRETCFGRDHLLVATSLFHLGILLKRQPHKLARQEALALLRRALDIRMTKLGEKHALTKVVRKALNELQVTLQTQRFTSVKRSLDLPYSSLTWHEEELHEFEKRARQKAEQEELKKQMDKTQDQSSTASMATRIEDLANYMSEASVCSRKTGALMDSDSLDDAQQKLTVESMPDGYVGRTVANDAETKSEKGSTEAGQESVRNETVTAVSGAEDNATSKQKESQYLDSFVFQISDPQLSRFRCTRPHSTALPTTASRHAADGQSKVKRGHSLSDTLGYYAALADERRIQSAPPCNRMPMSAYSISNVYHRLNCPFPDPNRISISNSYSVVYGPHTSIESLLGAPEIPRYNVISSGVHHNSAWYPPAGRHRLLGKSRRLQGRTNQSRRNLIEVTLVSQPTAQAKESLYANGSNNYRSAMAVTTTATRGVHFDRQNLESVQGHGLMSH